MFVAKFSATTGAPFVADKNGNFPMIGEVLAGTAKGTLINGTMFKRAGLEPNKLYACDNSTSEDYPDNVQVDVVSSVSIIEYLELRSVLGAGKLAITEEVDEDRDLVPAKATKAK